MVRAILDGRKTQTRRVWKMPRGLTWYVSGSLRGEETGEICDPASSWWGHVEEMRCPYGEVGDRLYVRETWAQPSTLDPGPTFYRADYPDNVLGKYENLPPAEAIRWKPSIHMPRSLSRILLELTAVRVERLNDCSEADAIAEGVEPMQSEREAPDQSICRWCGGTRLYTAFSAGGGALPDTDCLHCDTHLKRYEQLWDHINGDGAWEANPWVWVVEFQRMKKC
jgi:hypothetical protein